MGVKEAVINEASENGVRRGSGLQHLGRVGEVRNPLSDVSGLGPAFEFMLQEDLNQLLPLAYPSPKGSE